jgi:hypothetical protein
MRRHLPSRPLGSEPRKAHSETLPLLVAKHGNRVSICLQPDGRHARGHVQGVPCDGGSRYTNLSRCGSGSPLQCPRLNTELDSGQV